MAVCERMCRVLQVRMSGFSAQELSNLAVSLARLEYRPPDSWLDTFAAATAARMHSFEAQVRLWGRVWGKGNGVVFLVTVCVT